MTRYRPSSSVCPVIGCTSFFASPRDGSVDGVGGIRIELRAPGAVGENGPLLLYDSGPLDVPLVLPDGDVLAHTAQEGIRHLPGRVGAGALGRREAPADVDLLVVY